MFIRHILKERETSNWKLHYLDGALHVQLSEASNSIIKAVAAALKNPELLAIAFLCTPTDVHVIPQEASEASAENLSNAPIWQKIAAMLKVFGLRKNKLKPVENMDRPGKHIYLVGRHGKRSGAKLFFSQAFAALDGSYHEGKRPHCCQ